MRFRRAVAAFLLTCACAAEITWSGLDNSVIFLGDSITAELGRLSELFGAPGSEWVNAGVHGQNSSQLVTFLDSLQPSKVVRSAVIQIGINDLAQGQPDVIPPGSSEHQFRSVGGNIQIICDRMREKGIRPIVATVLPVARDFPRGAVINPRVETLNAWIRNYATRTGTLLIDYAPAFTLADGSGNSTLLRDGIHPNAEGRSVLAQVARPVLRAAGALP